MLTVPYAGCSAWEASPLQSLTGGLSCCSGAESMICSGFVWCMQVMTARPRMAAPPNRGQGAGYSSDNSAQMLSVLTPEARTLVLAAMAPSQRWCVMEAMKDEERAEIIISMGLELRKDAAAALDPKTWERTMDAVKNNGTFAARWAGAWLMQSDSECHGGT